jgi:hypothetical protein
MGARSETVAIPVEGTEDLFLYATLEEDVMGGNEGLRAFVAGARVMIAAYDDSGVFKAEMIGTVTGADANKTFAPDNPTALDTEVTAGNSYTFIAYSFNNMTDPPGNSALTDNTLEGIDPSVDLLYGKSELTEIVAGNNAVVISMRHQFSLVRVTAKSTVGPAAYITGIEAVLKPAYTADLPLIGASMGVLSQGAGVASPQEFDFTIGTNRTQVTSSARTVYTDGAGVTRVEIPTVTVAGTGTITDLGEIGFGFPLEYSTSYTLTISMGHSLSGRWATSNVYWDGDRLTFDAAGTPKMPNVMYSGVFFRWGSLVGISASEAWDSNITLYVPTYGGESTPEASSWTEGNPTSLGGDISYLESNVNDQSRAILYEESTPANYGSKLGDICKYIGDTGAGPKGYRMPTGNEFAVSNNWLKSGDFTKTLFAYNPVWTEGSPDGKSTVAGLPQQYLAANVNVAMPSTGWRDAGGAISFFPSEGRYWDSSALGDDVYSHWLFSSTGGLLTYATAKHSFVVRCIRVP